MSVPSDPDDVDRLRSRPSLGPIDVEAVSRAAEILRDRTMSLEEHDPFPARRLLIWLVVLTVLAAAALVLLRVHVKSFLGLGLG